MARSDNILMYAISTMGLVGSVLIALFFAIQMVSVTDTTGDNFLLVLIPLVVLVASALAHVAINKPRPMLPAIKLARIAISLNSCLVFLNIMALWTLAGEGQKVVWATEAPLLLVCFANILAFAIYLRNEGRKKYSTK